MKLRSVPFSRCLLLGLSCLLASGCGGGAEDKWSKNRLKTYPVQGLVTYKGSPVADATVSFSPVAKDQPGAVGRTDANGRFELRTYEAGDGAIEGEHKISVTKAETEPVDPSYTDVNSPNYGKEPPPTKTIFHVPEKFSKFETSGLTAKVAASDKNEIPLELKD